MIKSKENRNSKKIIKENIILIITTVLYWGIMGFLYFIPIVFNYQDASGTGKVFMIIGSSIFIVLQIAFLVGFEIMNHKDVNKGKHPVAAARIFYSSILLSHCYLILKYFSEDVWGTLTAFYGMAGLIIIVYGLYSVIRHFDSMFNKEKLPMIILAMAIFFVFMGLSTVDSDLQDGELYTKIGLGGLYAIFIAVFLNLTIYTKEKPNKEKHKVLLLITRIVIALSVLMTFPYYVMWCGLKGAEYNTFVQVYSAVVGGGLTLAGVAWTINKGNKDRRIDEIKKYKPVFNLIEENEIEAYDIPLQELRENDYLSFSDNLGKKYQIESFGFENTDLTAFYFIGFKINNLFLPFDSYIYIKKSSMYGINSDKVFFYFKVDIVSIQMVLRDLLGNFYTANLKWEFDLKPQDRLKNCEAVDDNVNYIFVYDIDFSIEDDKLLECYIGDKKLN